MAGWLTRRRYHDRSRCLCPHRCGYVWLHRSWFCHCIRRGETLSNLASYAKALADVFKGIGGAFAFLAKNPILCIGILFVAAWLIWGTGCVRLPFTESREHAIARANQAQTEAKVKDLELDRNAEIGRIARDVAVLRSQLSSLSEQGHDEIAAATPTDEAPIDPGLVAAWRNSVERLCLYPTDANGHLPDSCGRDAHN